MFVCKCLAELKKVWLSLIEWGRSEYWWCGGKAVVCGWIENGMWNVWHIIIFFIDLKLLSSLLISANLGEGWIGDNPSGNYESGECHSVHSKCQTPQV